MISLLPLAEGLGCGLFNRFLSAHLGQSFLPFGVRARIIDLLSDHALFPIYRNLLLQVLKLFRAYSNQVVEILLGALLDTLIGQVSVLLYHFERLVYHGTDF